MPGIKFFSPRIGGAIIFWLAAGALQKLDWGDGAYIALLLLAFAASAIYLGRHNGERSATFDDRLPGIALILVGLALLFQIVFMFIRLGHPSALDITVTTFDAGRALLKGLNPYAIRLDPYAAGTPSPPEFSGYKYLPVMALIYLPLAAVFGAAGMVLTNLLCQFGVIAGIYTLGRKLRDRRAGLFAVLIYLTIPLVTFQLFAKGATDIAATLPLIFALVLYELRPFGAGLLVGLSISTKLSPGLMLIPSCLPAGKRDRWTYLGGIAVGLLPTLGFLLWSPLALWNNVVVFNWERGVDTTSWLSLMPTDFASVAHVALFMLLAASFVLVWSRPPTLRMRIALAVVLILAALLSGPGAHHNYHLWWLPLFCPLLMAADWSAPWSLKKSPS